MKTIAPMAPSGRTVAVLATAGIVAAVMQTLVVPLLVELPAILNTNSANASWVVTATLLAGAVAVPTAGRLGDMFGKRRMILVSVIPLIVGSVVCALSTSVVPMIVGRGLQGLGMGVVPLGISLLRDVVAKEKLGSAIAVMSASLGVGGALGLPFAAVVAQNGSWQILFWVAAGLSLLVGVLIFTLVPAGQTPTTHGRFDLVGSIGIGAGLVMLLLGVSKGSTWGWGSSTTLIMLIGSVVVFAAWGWWELRSESPLVDLRVTARPTVLFTNLASTLIGFAMYAQSLVLPQLLQLPTETGYGLGQSMVQMGLWLLPSGVVMMLISPVGATLSEAKSPKFTLIVGGLIIALGYLSAQVLLGSVGGILVVAIICGAGVGFAYGAMPAIIMGAVPREETASANSFNTLTRSVGTSISAAVIGVVLAQMTTPLAGHAVPSEGGFRVALLIGAAVAIGASALTALIPMNKTAATAPVVQQKIPAVAG